MEFNGLKLSSVLEEFSITLQFLGSKMQKKIKENEGFGCSLFLHIVVQVISKE